MYSQTQFSGNLLYYVTLILIFLHSAFILLNLYLVTTFLT